MDCDNCDCVNKCVDTLEEILEFEPNADDLLVSELNIPEKINIICDDELPSLEELDKEEISEPEPTDDLTTNKNLSAEQMERVMTDIENTVNFTSLNESMHALNNPDILLNRIQTAFNTFKEQTGRQMTYSEMRWMMG